MRDAYIVTSIRTPGCKRGKGAFSDTRPEDLLSFILSTAVERTPNLQKKDVEDIMVGCCFPEAEQGLNIGRLVSQIAGFPAEVTGATVNRFCASGLEAITAAALKGEYVAIIGAVDAAVEHPRCHGVVLEQHQHGVDRRGSLKRGPTGHERIQQGP